MKMIRAVRNWFSNTFYMDEDSDHWALFFLIVVMAVFAPEWYKEWRWKRTSPEGYARYRSMMAPYARP